IAAKSRRIDSSGQVSNHDRSIAILRHQRISHELAVARNLRRLDRAPRIKVLMRQRPLCLGVLLAQSRHKRTRQQSDYTNQRRCWSRQLTETIHKSPRYLREYFQPRLEMDGQVVT